MPRGKSRSWLMLLAWLILAGCQPQRAIDLLATDTADNPRQPASMHGVVLPSHGAALNGVVYRATGAGPHPTALFLHGFPGNELNLDLAQALRRGGWNILWFHYRGSWGSEGEFSIAHALEDARAVLQRMRQPDFASENRIDPGRLSVLGHSMGGFVALMSAAVEPELRCAVSIAGANFGPLAQAAADPALRARAVATFQAWGSGPIRGMSGERLAAEVEAAGAQFDLRRQARALATRPVLLVAGERDRTTPPDVHHDPLLAAIRAAGGVAPRELRLDADHAFSARRVALARGVIAFMDRNCR